MIKILVFHLLKKIWKNKDYLKRKTRKYLKMKTILEIINFYNRMNKLFIKKLIEIYEKYDNLKLID